MVRPTDEYERAERLRVTCTACFVCGRALGPRSPVWLASRPVCIDAGICRVLRGLPYCVKCAEQEEAPERLRKAVGRPYEACGRMTFEALVEAPSQRRRRFCCLRCGNRYYEARRQGRKK